jgi:ketosteroid isomerase-like protein
VKINTYAIILLCIFSFAYETFAQSDQRTNEVLAAVKAYDAAWNAKDVKSAGAIMDDKYIYFNSLGGAPRPKSFALEFLGQPDYKLTFVERSELQVFGSGDVAVVSSRWKGKGTWSGGPIDDDQRCGLVFVEQKKEWKLLSEHCVQIVTK